MVRPFLNVSPPGLTAILVGLVQVDWYPSSRGEAICIHFIVAVLVMYDADISRRRSLVLWSPQPDHQVWHLTTKWILFYGMVFWPVNQWGCPPWRTVLPFIPNWLTSFSQPRQWWTHIHGQNQGPMQSAAMKFHAHLPQTAIITWSRMMMAVKVLGELLLRVSRF